MAGRKAPCDIVFPPFAPGAKLADHGCCQGQMAAVGWAWGQGWMGRVNASRKQDLEAPNPPMCPASARCLGARGRPVPLPLYACPLSQRQRYCILSEWLLHREIYLLLWPLSGSRKTIKPPLCVSLTLKGHGLRNCPH